MDEGKGIQVILGGSGIDRLFDPVRRRYCILALEIQLHKIIPNYNKEISILEMFFRNGI